MLSVSNRFVPLQVDGRGSLMTCDEAREWLSLVSHGGVGLTDWALLETHVRQCEDCRKLEQLRQIASSSQALSTARPPLQWLSEMRDGVHLRMAGFATWASRQLSVARVVSGQAAGGLISAGRAAATWLVDRPTQPRWLLSGFCARTTRAFVSLIGTAGLTVSRLADTLGRLRLPLVIARPPARRTAVGATDVARDQSRSALELATRLVRPLLSGLSTASRRTVVHVIGACAILITVFRHAAWTMAAAGRATATRGVTALTQTRSFLSAAFDQAGVRTFTASRSAGRMARGIAARTWNVLSHAVRLPVLGAGAGVVGLAILVAATPSWWPRDWPADRAPGLSTGERRPQHVRPPIDRKSAEAAVAARPVRASSPATLPKPLPLVGSPSAIPPDVAQHPEAHTDGLASQSRPDRAGSQRVTAEASDDAAAAVDWLLKNTRARRPMENP